MFLTVCARLDGEKAPSGLEGLRDSGAADTTEEIFCSASSRRRSCCRAAEGCRATAACLKTTDSREKKAPTGMPPRSSWKTACTSRSRCALDRLVSSPSMAAIISAVSTRPSPSLSNCIKASVMRASLSRSSWYTSQMADIVKDKYSSCVSVTVNRLRKSTKFVLEPSAPRSCQWSQSRGQSQVATRALDIMSTHSLKVTSEFPPVAFMNPAHMSGLCSTMATITFCTSFIHAS
mmetsp:Transcript_80027/g.226888  ORF Transcript_80027/g.226888 Transcript_80027/m.226888 type:complete len:234 (-) Transcript_80027:272-973(-)